MAINFINASYRVRNLDGKLLATVSALALAHWNFGTGAALAQEQERALDTVIVTAQKRAQNIQDVPISIEAITPEDLEAQRVIAIDDYLPSVPNTNLTRSSTLAPDVTIRGINTNTGGLFDAIGVSIDGASFGVVNSSTILGTQLFDMERVEVLRGPQGALSGNNALGGALNYIYAKPDLDGFSGEVSADYGRFNSLFLSGVMNAPVNDRLGFRFAGFSDNSDGAVDNIGPAGGSSDKQNYGLRGSVKWLPTDAITVDGWVSYEDQGYGLDTQFGRFVAFPTGTIGDLAADFNALGGADFGDQDFLGGNADNNGANVIRDIQESTDIEILMGSLSANLDAGNHDFRIQYSMFEYEADVLRDNDASEFAFTATNQLREVEAHYVEARVSSDYDGNFNWLAGIAYVDERSGNRSLREDGDGAIAGAYGFGNASADVISVESFGVFANAEFKPVERLTLTAGFRFAEDSIDLSEGFIFDDPGFVSAASVPEADSFAGIATTESSVFLPRLTATYAVSDSVNFYAQYAQGYRPGFANGDSAIDLGLTAVSEVDNELVTNYELGVKGDYLDGRVGLTAAAFYMQYEDLQVSRYAYVADEGYVYFSENATEAYSRGFEVSAALRPTDDLEVEASLGYVDTEIEQIVYYGTEFNDIEIPATRPWTATLTSRYEREVADGLDAFGRIQYTYRQSSKEFFDQSQISGDLPESSVLDLSIGLEADRWRVTAYFDNLLDDTYWISNSRLGGFGSIRGTFSDFVPRTYGLRFNYKFGAQ